MKISNSGFSLQELILSSVVMSIVLLCACQIILAITKDMKFFDSRINQSQNILNVNKLIDLEFNLSSGNFLQAWQSIGVENDCKARDGLPDCGGTDRITLATSLFNEGTSSFFPRLPVQSFDAVSNKIFISFSLPSNPCVLNSSFNNKHILLLDNNIYNTFSLWTKSYDLSSCSLQVEPDLQGVVLNSPDYLLANYSGGIVTFLRLRTYFLNSSRHSIDFLEKSSNLPELDPADIRSQIDNVYDFQISMGYDTLPYDGVISDNSSDSDEIMYNHKDDKLSTLGGFGGKISDLRQLQVSLDIGNSKDIKTFSSLPTSTVTADNKIYSSRLERKIYFRNPMLYQ